MAVLEVINLQKGFGSTDVLKGVSFSLEQGQVLAIIGSSGSGKTTLLRCLNFLETPQQGTITVNGNTITLVTDESIQYGASTTSHLTFTLDKDTLILKENSETTVYKRTNGAVNEY